MCAKSLSAKTEGKEGNKGEYNSQLVALYIYQVISSLMLLIPTKKTQQKKNGHACTFKVL